ncbi:MAG TPA: preprotein translocase subunit SecA [Candidatus Magasanikbacteria bacterium]|nr:preprotein translocase subunit SecA [Candidatus Magasanikbacteria bacterium]
MSFLAKIFGDPNAKIIKDIMPVVEKINSFESTIQKLSMEELRGKTIEFKKRLANGETLEDILPEAFAVVREASKRITGMRHYDTQLIGGIVLHRGQISEMHTGEGKTLVATLPVYLNALTGKGVHVVTVNDYLAKRDAVWMGQIYDTLGLSVGVIQNLLVSYKFHKHEVEVKDEAILNDENKKENTAVYKVKTEYLISCKRQEAYQCDIIYGTNNEFGFDYLRDNMVGSLMEMSQRPLYYAIVDEVDSILIDEARTPLIISAPAQKATDTYYKFAALVKQLKENEDYNVDEKMRSATLTENGIHKIEKALGVENIYVEGGIQTVHHVEQALKAETILKRDRDYVVENGEVVIVDEFTGRKMPGRRYSEGLHQAIEAKEGVQIQRESQTMATVTFQNYFRMYEKLAGMTGTAVTEAEEFGKIYKLEVVTIPTNKQRQRKDLADRIYRTEDVKFKAIAKEVKALQLKGQPVLIGTISVDKNEILSQYLEMEGVHHEILNAKNHEREGEIIAQAGAPGAVTLATNMAGRGVDIILGGNPQDPEKAKKVRELGGLFVIGTERHESRRIDNQLRGRAGRQGDPGMSQFYLSTEDDLMRIFAGDRIRGVMQTLKVPDDMPIENKTISKIIESAQRKVEGFHFDARKHLLEYDDVLNKHREVIYSKRRQVLKSFDTEKSKLRGENIVLAADFKPLRDIILEMVEQEIESVVSFHTNYEDHNSWNFKEIAETVSTIFPLNAEEKDKILNFKPSISSGIPEVEERSELTDYLVKLSKEKYEDLLVKKISEPEFLLEIEKQVLLRGIDNLWIEHLVAIDYLRTGIGLRGYGQRDPLVEYKKETYHMFNELLSYIQKEIVYTIYKVTLGVEMSASALASQNLVFQGAEKEAGDSAGASIRKNQNKEIGRNDPCPCGSGKKFKKCCGA